MQVMTVLKTDASLVHFSTQKFLGPNPKFSSRKKAAGGFKSYPIPLLENRSQRTFLCISYTVFYAFMSVLLSFRYFSRDHISAPLVSFHVCQWGELRLCLWLFRSLEWPLLPMEEKTSGGSLPPCFDSGASREYCITYPPSHTFFCL